MNFGGLNIDEVITDCCMQNILEDLTYKNGEKFNTNDDLNPQLEKKIRQKLRIACEQAKIHLSTEMYTMIIVDKVMADDPNFNDLDFEMEITR